MIMKYDLHKTNRMYFNNIRKEGKWMGIKYDAVENFILSDNLKFRRIINMAGTGTIWCCNGKGKW